MYLFSGKKVCLTLHGLQTSPYLQSGFGDSSNCFVLYTYIQVNTGLNGTHGDWRMVPKNDTADNHK